MVKVSIITPVFNAEPYLRDCIDSVIMQSFAEWEMILVDDGSTDGSGGILDEYAARDSRVKVIHQKNAGAGAARNVALRVASGDWLAFLDADDMYAPYWLEVAVAQMYDDIDFIRQQYYFGKTPPQGFTERPKETASHIYKGNDASCWCYETFPRKGFMSLGIIRRRSVGSVQFRAKVTSKQDSVWLMELIPQIRAVCVTDFVGYFYRKVSSSLSRRTKSTQQCVAYLNALRDIWTAQKEWSQRLGISDLICSELSFSADFNVVEWLRNEKLTKDEVLIVRKSYLAFQSGLKCSCQLQIRYKGAFWIWRYLGWRWPISVVERGLELIRRVRGCGA